GVHELTNDFGKPKNFSITDSKPGVDKLLAGIVDTASQELLDNLGLSVDMPITYDGGVIVGNGIYDDWKTSLENKTLSGFEKLLMLRSVDKAGESDGDAPVPQPIAAGFKSDSFTLSASSYYKLSVWVKTLGGAKASIILGSENPSNTDGVDPWFAGIEAESWTQYVLYIEVGLTSVSNATLSLWLGTDYKTAAQYTEDTAKSSGTALFDSVELETITQRDYELASDGERTKMISYMTDSFDTVASSDADRTTVASPSKWTGQTDVTSLSSSNTVAGVADTRYVEINNAFGLKTDNDASTETAPSPDEIAASKITQDELAAHTGNKLLVVNNIRPSAYSFTSNSYSFSSLSYYKVSLWVKTVKVDAEKGAYIQLYMDAENTLIFEGVNTDAAWVQYTFYAATANSSLSPTVKVGLGKFISDDDESGLLAGYLMADDVRIDKMTESKFNELFSSEDEGGKFLPDPKYNQVRVLDKYADIADDENTTDDDGTTVGTPSEYTWLWISSIVFGAVTIIVVVVYFIKKYRKPRKKDPESEPSYSKDADGSLTMEAKEEKYNEFKD
ncbi:MAG: hypothetical protein LBC13_03900, partial [Clostridiales bacterium]|nr:hypothetical protein [Clostridiales bacterium]